MEREEQEKRRIQEHKKLVELERQRREEEERCRDLESQAQMWRKAIELQEYIAMVEKKGHDKKLPEDQGESFINWLSWAKQHADRIDPLTGRLPFEDSNHKKAP